MTARKIKTNTGTGIPVVSLPNTCVQSQPTKQKRVLQFRFLLSHDGVKVSTTKCLQLIGGLVGSAVVIYTAYKGTGDLVSLYMAYLAYTASIDGYTKFLLAKQGKVDTPSGSEATANQPTVDILPALKDGDS